MCVESAGRVASVAADGIAVADFAGVRRPVSLVVLETEGEPVAVGDWLAVHCGIAVRRVSEAEAEELCRLCREAGSS